MSTIALARFTTWIPLLLENPLWLMNSRFMR